MPFVASFCDIWLPAEAVISERSIRIITRELERRGVGVIMIHAPSGSVLVAMRTRVHRRVCNDVGLKPGACLSPELVSAAVAAFGVWHMAASAAEIRPLIPKPMVKPIKHSAAATSPPTAPPISNLRARMTCTLGPPAGVAACSGRLSTVMGGSPFVPVSELGGDRIRARLRRANKGRRAALAN
jgi:hypothetical protein